MWSPLQIDFSLDEQAEIRNRVFQWNTASR